MTVNSKRTYRLQEKIMKLLVILFASMVMAGAMILADGAGAQSANSNKVFYFVPHQDDETLTMGASIAAHVKAGKEVHVVLLTDGAASSAIQSVNARLKNEGRSSITTGQFSAARDVEFVAATQRLGVQQRNLHYERLKDGQTTSHIAEAVVDRYLAMYEGASFKSMSWLDLHKDHYLFGYALNNRCVKNPKIDCRFYQFAPYQKTNPTALAVNKVAIPKSGIYRDAVAIQAAAAEYRIWNPSQGRYSIGYLSVRSSFDYLIQNPTSLYHLNNVNWTSKKDQDEARRWIQTVQQGH